MSRNNQPPATVATVAQGRQSKCGVRQPDDANHTDGETRRQVLLARLAGRYRITAPHATTIAHLAGLGVVAW